MSRQWFTLRFIRNLLIVLVLIFLLWYFFEILVLVAIAMLVAIAGSPLVKILDRISIRQYHLPDGFCVTIILLLLLGFFAGLFFVLVPLFLEQVNVIASINFDGLFSFYQREISWLEDSLHKMGIMADNYTLATFIKEQSMAFLDFNQISGFATGILSFTGSFLFNLFSVLFISWYLMYDFDVIHNFMVKMVPKNYKSDTEDFLKQSRTLISRYVLGLILDTLAVMVSFVIILSLLGIKGAIVIAVLAGLLNLIPYIGPVIGVLIGIVIGLTTVVSTGAYVGLDMVALKIGLSMLAVIILDNIFYEPYIQGKSIHAHPLEILLVIMAGEVIGGVVAMIVIVPAYGVLKIMVTRFLHHFPQIQKIDNLMESN